MAFLPGGCHIDVMVKGTPERPRDSNQLAKLVVDIATGSAQNESINAGKNPAAVELGRLGRPQGGEGSRRKLTPEQRSAIAKKAAQSRFGKQPGAGRRNDGSKNEQDEG